jgi:hypothetical protein
MELLEKLGVNTIICDLAEKTFRIFGRYRKERGGKTRGIVFKVLAAGVIRLGSGFDSASRNGADFIWVGMFNSQVAQNMVLALDILGKTWNRERAWVA